MLSRPDPNSALDRLQRAVTFRDLFRLPFPLTVAPVTVSASGDAPFSDASAGGTHTGDATRFTYNRFDGAMAEPLRLSLAFETAARPDANLCFTSEFRLAGRPRRSVGVRVPHPDVPQQPKARVFLYSSCNPTRVVHHADMLDLLERRAPDALDLDLDRGNCLTFAKAMRPLRDDFLTLGRALPDNAVSVITGMTYHYYQDAPDDSDRQFSRSFVFDSDGTQPGVAFR